MLLWFSGLNSIGGHSIITMELSQIEGQSGSTNYGGDIIDTYRIVLVFSEG